MPTKGSSNQYGNAKNNRPGHPTSHTGFAWAKDFRKTSLARHVASHMQTMGFQSASEYRAHAVAFANRVDRVNHISYVRKNGDTVKYSIKTNEFAVIDRKGMVTTYFHPAEGISYYYNDYRRFRK